MPKEDAYSYKLRQIRVGSHSFELATLNNGSFVYLANIRGTLPNTFWTDLQFEVEQALGVQVKNMDLKPLFLVQPASVHVVHIIHEPVERTEPFVMG